LVVAAFVAAISVCSGHIEANGNDIFTGAPISLDLDDAQLIHVIGPLAELTDFFIAVDAQTVAEGGIDRLVTVEYKSVPWDQALHEILAEAGLEWTLEGKVLWIHLPSYRPAGDRRFTGEPIKLRLEDADLRDVLNTLAKVTGVTIHLDSGIEGSLTLNVRDIPWDQMFDFILRVSGLDYAQIDNAISVFRVSEGNGMQFMASSP
jgi:type II secretory pathway component HofQ